MVWDTICNFCSAKSYKIPNNSATAKARAKVSTYLESLEFKKNDASQTKLENSENLCNKITQRFLATTKLFSGGGGEPHKEKWYYHTWYFES